MNTIKANHKKMEKYDFYFIELNGYTVSANTNEQNYKWYLDNLILGLRGRECKLDTREHENNLFTNVMIDF